MNILYIEHYAGSLKYGMEFRPYYLAKNWAKWGNNVTIIAASYSHLRIKNPSVHTDFQEEEIDGIKYVWIKTRSYKGNSVGRAINIYQFLSKIRLNATKIADKYNPDVVIASSTYPMDTYVAQKICKLSGAVLIHEVHDMWPICPMELYNFSKYNPIIMYIQAAENSFCKHSDGIVSIQPCAEQYYLQHGMPKGNFYHIPNGIVKEDWNNSVSLPVEMNKVIDKLHEKYKRIICFFGSHTKSYALDYLLKAAERCKKESIAFLFVGDGNKKKELIQLKNRLNLDSVIFMNPVSKQCIPSLLSKVDGIYIGALNNAMFKYGSCMNKTYDAMMSGKPIIFANPAPNNYVEDYKCGITAAAEDVNDLERAIKKFLQLDDKTLEEMGKRGKKAVLEHFEYENLSREFLKIIKLIKTKKEI